MALLTSVMGLDGIDLLERGGYLGCNVCLHSASHSTVAGVLHDRYIRIHDVLYGFSDASGDHCAGFAAGCEATASRCMIDKLCGSITCGNILRAISENF